MLSVRSSLCGRNLLKYTQIRNWSTEAVHLNEKINKDLENEVYKPKDHPGRVCLKTVEIPDRVQEAIKNAVNNNQIPQLLEDGVKLDRYLFARHIPLEQKEIYVAKREIERDLLNHVGVHRASKLGLIMI